MLAVRAKKNVEKANCRIVKKSKRRVGEGNREQKNTRARGGKRTDCPRGRGGAHSVHGIVECGGTRTPAREKSRQAARDNGILSIGECPPGRFPTGVTQGDEHRQCQKWVAVRTGGISYSPHDAPSIRTTGRLSAFLGPLRGVLRRSCQTSCPLLLPCFMLR